VSATLSVSKWSGAIFRPRISQVSFQKVFLCPLHCKPRESGVNWETLGLESIPPVPGNRAEVGQYHDACKAVFATHSVLKWSEAIFRPRSSKPSVRSFYLCPFHYKPTPSGIILESPVLKNIPQVPGYRAKVGLNHHGRKAVTATLWVLKWSATTFWPRSL